jgi:predicted HicB family RNase H-like nuclease
MAKKKLTLTIEEKVIKAAKKKAVDADTSLSAEVERHLEEWAKDPPPENAST